MPIKTYDSQDAIPEAQRPAAIETKDGKFIVDDRDDYRKLRESIEAERTRAAQQEKARKEAEQKAADLETRMKAAEAGLTDEKLKELRTSVQADLEREYAPYKDKAEKWEKAERRTLLDDPVKKAMLSKDVKVLPEKVDKLWKQIADDFDLTADGKPMVKDHPGMSVEQYLASEVKKEYSEWFQGSQAAGGGAGGTVSGGSTPFGGGTEKPVTQWTSDQRRAFINEHGIEAYDRKLADYARTVTAKAKERKQA